MQNDLRRWMTLCEDISPMVQQLLSQVPSLQFVPVDGKRWRTIRDEGLDEEQNALRREQWVMTRLRISQEQADGLQAFDDETVELFNAFDIHLKQQFGGKIIDLIDYDKGVVVLVKVVSNE